MSLLSEIVDEASKLRTQRITLKEGKRPSFLTIKGAIEPKKFKPLTPSEMDNLFSSIFAQAGELLRHQRHARKIKILELGEVNCIGLTDLRQINIYLTSGAVLYSLDHSQFFPKTAGSQQEEEQTSTEGTAGDASNNLINEMIDLNVSLGDENSESLLKSPPTAAEGEDDAGGIDIPVINADPALPAAEDEQAALDDEGTGVYQPEDKADPQIELLAATDAASDMTDAAVASDATDDEQKQDEQLDKTVMHEVIEAHTEAPKIDEQLDQAVTADQEELVKDSGVKIAPVPAKDDGQTILGGSAAGAGLASSGANRIDKLLQEMAEKKASDLHLSSHQPVVMRIGGQMERIRKEEKITPENLESWLSPITPPIAAKAFEQHGDAYFTYELEGTGRFRVSIFRELNGLGAVLRHVPAVLKSLDALEAPEIVKKFCYLSKGLVIINGPAGSGRSTTMAAMIDVINSTRKAHLLAIEDPIEFVHTQKSSLIRQREVSTHTDSIQEGLRAALREDVDVVCTDETSDAPTTMLVMRCAEAGRLVFSTMHTRTSVSAIDSIVNQFPPAYQHQARQLLADTLRGVICQTLVRKKDGGRVAAWEVLIVSDEAAAMIRGNRTRQITAHMIAHRVKGNILLNDSLLKLVADETVAVRQAIAATPDKRAFYALAQRRGMKFAA